jgi:chromosome segregation ATPase
MYSSSPPVRDTGDDDSDSSGPSYHDLRRENSQLSQANLDLTNQLSYLRRQFDSALSVSTTIDGVLSKTAEAVHEISQLKAERDDLAHRLHIALQANQEAELRLRELKATSLPDPSDISTGLRQQKRALEDRVRSLESELQKERRQSTQLHTDHDQTEFQLENIFQAASKYFGLLIDSHQTLLHCFIQPTAQDDIENLTRANARLTSQLQKIRTETSSFELVRQRLEMELAVANNQLSQNEGEFSREIALLEARVKDQLKVIANLTRERDELVADGHEKTTQIKIMEIKAEDARNAENVALANQLSDAVERVNALIGEKHELEKRILKLGTKLDNAEKRAAGLDAKLHKVQESKSASKLDHAKVAASATENEMKVRELEGKLARAQDEIAAKRREVEKVSESFTPIENQLKQQGRDMTDIRRERDDLLAQLHKEAGLKQIVENQVQQLQHKIAQREREIQELQTKLQEALRPVDVSDLVPASCWTSPELPSELHDVVRDIGRNPHVQISTKIRNCMDTISKWFKLRAHNFEGELAEGRQDVAAIKANVNMLLGFLKRLMPEVRINFDLLLTDDLTRQMFGEAVMSLKKNIESSEQQKTNLESRLLAVVRELGFTDIEEIKAAISHQSQVISDLRNRVRQEKKGRLSLDKLLKQTRDKIREISDTSEALEAENSNLRREISDFDVLVSDKSSEIKRLEGVVAKISSERDNAIGEKEQLDLVIVKLHRRRERTESQVKALQEAMQDLEKRHKESARRDREAAQLRYDQLAEQTTKQIGELQELIRERSERAARFEQSNAELQSKNSDLILGVQRLETKAKAIQMECDRDKKALESQMNARLMSVESEYKSRLEEAHVQVTNVKNRMAEAVMRQLAGFIDGMKVTDANFEVALQLVKRKLELMAVREGHIRNVLQLESYQSIEDGISAISYRRKHRSNG